MKNYLNRNYFCYGTAPDSTLVFSKFFSSMADIISSLRFFHSFLAATLISDEIELKLIVFQSESFNLFLVKRYPN